MAPSDNVIIPKGEIQALYTTFIDNEFLENAESSQKYSVVPGSLVTAD